MVVVITELVEDGIPYRITEDEEIGLYIKESIQEVELPIPKPTPEEKIAQLEAENADVWYELMLKEILIQQHDVDIADLFYLQMTGGMQHVVY